MTGGSPPAEIDICDGPDRLQIEISAMSTKMTGGSPPAEIGISKSPDRLQTEISVTSMEMAGGSPPALVDICEGPDRIETRISVTYHVNDDMNADLPGSLAAMLRSPMIFQRPCVVDWKDIFCGRTRYGGQDGHDMIDMDSSDPNARKRIDTADLLHMCRTVAHDH